MYCPKCGKENADTATFCSTCGNRLSAQASTVQEPVGNLPHSTAELKKTSVVLLVFLTIITFGIYYPVWFLRRRSGINSLQSKEKLGSGVFVFAIVVFSISLFVTLLSGAVEGLAEGLGEMDLMLTAKRLDLFSRILNLVAGITLLVQCFKVRRIFNEHFNVNLKRDIQFSGVATFFFQIYYLQYKANRF
jgi:hypothetical protein